MSLKAKAQARIKVHQRAIKEQGWLRSKIEPWSKQDDSILMMRQLLLRSPTESLQLLIQKRLDHLMAVERSEQRIFEERERCRGDVLYWIDNYAWTYDPRLEQAYVPMKLWERQLEYIHWLQQRESRKEDGVVEKSRDAGATWLSALYLLHHWLFVPGFKGAIGSRKEDLVDKSGDPDSIFEKLRIALRFLPSWMKPANLNPKIHCSYLKLVNPQNGSTITGDAGDNIGRGGRNTLYIVDEAAYIPRSDRVDSALSFNTDVKIYVSTPNGLGNSFYRKRFSGTIPAFTFTWKDDPRKNYWELRKGSGEVVKKGSGSQPGPMEGTICVYPWYEAQKIKYRYQPSILAQEIDLDYAASVEGLVIPAAWVRAAVDLRLPKRGPIRGALDVADEGGSKNVLTIIQGPTVLAVYSWTKGNTTQTAWKAIHLLEQHGASEFLYDAAGGYGSGIKGVVQSAERPIRMAVRGVNVGNPPTKDRWDDGRAAADKFANLKAELWWKLRRRFEKAYEFVEHGILHPEDEMISIPNHPDLIAQLSMVLGFETESGKARIESKSELKKRGVPSPDFADALVITQASAGAFAPVAGGEQVIAPSMVNFHGAGVAVANGMIVEKPID